MAKIISAGDIVSEESSTTNIAIHATVLLVSSAMLVLYGLRSKIRNELDAVKYINATKKFGWIKMTFSFFVGAGGSWTLYAIPSYISDPQTGIGIVGLIVLALANSLSLLFLSFVAPIVTKRHPTITSWNDFARNLFGKGAQALITFTCLFNIYSSFIVEYTGTAKLLSDIYKINDVYSILAVGIMTIMYSSIIGVSTSITTDFFQTISIVILLALSLIVMPNFKYSDFQKEENNYLGVTQAGYDSIFTVGIGTFSFYLLSDLLWQRIIATDTMASTRKSIFMSSLITLIVILIVGYVSIISSLSMDEHGNQELGLFYNLVSCQNCFSINKRALNIVTMILAIIINASSIDNSQSTMTATISSCVLSFFPSLHSRRRFALNLTRFIQFTANAICMVLATLKFKIINLYLISTLFACITSGTFLLGLNSTIIKCLNSHTVVIVAALTMLSSFVYYYILENLNPLQTFTTYYVNTYRKDTFLICIIAPYFYTILIFCSVYQYRYFKNKKNLRAIQNAGN